jgi:hypothetical protein
MTVHLMLDGNLILGEILKLILNQFVQSFIGMLTQ